MASLGEIWMADFPYEDDSSQSDERPVVIVGVDGELCLCATLMITRLKIQPKITIDMRFVIGDMQA